ncbi:MAG: DUF1177 family protein [Gemmatimonadaceae bacterium]
MSLQHTLAVFEALDSPSASAATVRQLIPGAPAVSFNSETVQGEKGSTDFVRVVIGGTRGKSSGGAAPTLAVVGRSGVGARPSRIGLVSDADGAVAAIAVARKLATMSREGDRLPGAT